MNKKGLAYVDWIISLSLFIVTVLMIFAFLRPGIVPTFESKDLINIVEKNFLEENSWEMVSIPLAIKKIENRSYSVVLEHVDQISEWKFIGYTSTQDLDNLHLEITNTSSEISITCKVGYYNCKTEISSGSPSTPGIYAISIEKDVVSEDKVFELEGRCSLTGAPDSCDYILGSKEIFKGLSERRIYLLVSELISYADLKEDWNFPDSRDFSIYLDYMNGTLIKATSPEFEPSNQANVFVKVISMSILESNGERKPAKVNIRVW
ncbi:hypothetical protein HOG54_03710 [Candidatus Woesearchaeota archaeon]|jgi:hypothetical protein|nr:hypothetical protein [Candidatus Woesearchaeota archaeon]